MTPRLDSTLDPYRPLRTKSNLIFFMASLIESFCSNILVVSLSQGVKSVHEDIKITQIGLVQPLVFHDDRLNSFRSPKTLLSGLIIFLTLTIS